MEFNEYKQINNKRYSPKEALAHYVVVSKEVIGESGKNLVEKLTNIFMENINNRAILEKVDVKSLGKIKNYWSLTIGQAVAYGYIVFSNLKFEDKNFTQDEITDMFIYVMQMYSPDNAVEFVEDKLKLDWKLS